MSVTELLSYWHQGELIDDHESREEGEGPWNWEPPNPEIDDCDVEEAQSFLEYAIALREMGVLGEAVLIAGQSLTKKPSDEVVERALAIMFDSKLLRLGARHRLRKLLLPC